MDLPILDDETSVEARIAAAEALFGPRKSAPAALTRLLFGGQAAEDLAGLDPEGLAAVAQAAWDFIGERVPGTPKLQVAPAASGTPAVSVVEIATDDMPFLVDSVLGELRERGLEPLLVAHPVIAVRRDEAGRLLEWSEGPPDEPGWMRESLIHLHVQAIEDAARAADIVSALGGVLAEVRLAVEDWHAMRARIEGIVAALETEPPPLPQDEVAEAVAFLSWLLADNFTLLGIREYTLADEDGRYLPDAATALGILRTPGVQVLRRGRELVAITPEVMEFLREPKALIITKANVRSRVHRRAHMDYVGIKRFDSSGRLCGELRLLGLFTATAYTRSARGIPYLRRKVEAVMTRAGFAPGSHAGRTLVNVLETYPRDELFQIDEDTLYRFALVVMRLAERPRLRVLARADRFDRFVSVLVYVPRDRYDTTVRAAIGEHLAGVYGGRIVAFYPWFPDGPMVRVHYIVARYAGVTPRPSRAMLEHAIADIILTWQDRLAQALAHSHAPDRARTLRDAWAAAFPADYRAAYDPATAVEDIRTLTRLAEDRPLGVTFYRRAADTDRHVRLKVWNYGRPIPLSERVPTLEHMGFRVVEESTFRLDTPSGGRFSLHDMTLERADGAAVDLDAAKRRLEACFLMTIRGIVESDGFNALALVAGLPWREIVLLRLLARMLRQTGARWSQDYMWATLARNPAIAEAIVALFHARFEPRANLAAEARAAQEHALVGEIEASLEKVHSLDEDRILRAFTNLVRAAVRTSFYQLAGDGQPKPVIAVKFDSRRIENLPRPRPFREIFVYSPRLEAVHLRFGKVARGGIRWSDRPQDFRAEVLGLVKAQQVKNAVIVPVGAKGGFVPKRLPLGDREAIQAEGIARYRDFIGALFDVTDQIGPDGAVVPAPVVRHDDDDPYLVVAADKGTATFSDIANAIARERGFWLDDAFASGGSAGYDHKRMGITARGAWESVKRHFREMNVEVARTPFTVAGVGDMSGDVFGNGMLRERTIRLVAAFDHRDIFLDPNPDPQTSFSERRRLFDLPRSSWQDYDRALISPGGGVYSRAAKEIALSPEARAALGIASERVTPADLMSAILRAPVDLMFFGGIGTYVRGAEETNDQVGDRANDAIRITGAELRAKVVAEGANLGMTQRGRIAAARAGVRLNTDAIDNSAGVNTSDVEVNLKIALGRPLRDGRLDRAARDLLLAAMTDEVAALVLRNNSQQTLAISLAERRGFDDLGFQQRLMQTLEQRGLLDRALEFLPDDGTIAERRLEGTPLTRPELAVLLAYAKLSLAADLLESAMPDDPYLGRELARYFPAVMVQRFPDALEAHRLRREIISTRLANSIVNRGGPTVVVRIADRTGASVDRIAAAFAAVRDAFDLLDLDTRIEALDDRVPGEVQLALLEQVQNLLLDRMVWMLRHVDPSGGLAAVVAHYRAGIVTIRESFGRILSENARQLVDARAADLARAGVPHDLAGRVAELPWLASATDAVLVAERTGADVVAVARTWFAAAAYFRLDGLVASARAIPVTDHFDRLALDRALDGLSDAGRRIVAEMMRASDGLSGARAVDAWVAPRRAAVERVRLALQEIAGAGLTVSRATVAASVLGDLAPQG